MERTRVSGIDSRQKQNHKATGDQSPVKQDPKTDNAKDAVKETSEPSHQRPGSGFQASENGGGTDDN